MGLFKKRRQKKEKDMRVLKSFLMVVGFSILANSGALAEKPEKVIQKSFEVSPGGILVIDTDFGSIDVRTHDKNMVDAEIIIKSKSSRESKFKSALEDFELTFNQDGNKIIIEGNWDRESWLQSNPFNLEFIMSIPKAFNVDLTTSGGSIAVDDLNGNVNTQTSGGSLNFGNITGEVNGKTSGGSIQVESCQGNIDVKTSGGSIKLGRIEGNVDAHTSGGSIKVFEVTGNIVAKTSGGGIYASLLRTPSSPCSFKTSGGSIEVRLSKDIKCSIDASTSGGGVYTDFPITVKGKWGGQSLRGDINGGGELIDCKTSGGGIKISEN